MILFGAGDGGGLIFGLHGVRPIPSFDPALRKQLQAMNLLSHALQLRGRHAPTDLISLTSRLADVIVGELEAVVGPLAEHDGLTYQDDSGGFTCGSNGKPPIPFAWPPVSGPSLEEHAATELLERELVAILRSGKLGIKELIDNPDKASKSTGVELSEHTKAQLRALAPAQIAKIPTPEGREIAWFFHKVLGDGRYVETWFIRPHEVAARLGVRLSDAALDRIVAGSSTVAKPNHGTNEVENAAIAVAVAVGVRCSIISRMDLADPETSAPLHAWSA